MKDGEDMGEIIFFDKTKAEFLKHLGFQYIEKMIDGQCMFVFIQTEELMKIVGENFTSDNFLISKTVNF